MIDSYDFGQIQINNQLYSQDVIIFSDKGKEKVISPWLREEGHYLQIKDLPKDLITEKPDLVIIGTGYSGIMRVDSQVKEYLENQGIETIIQTTREAWPTYNQFFQQRKVLALFHLTC